MAKKESKRYETDPNDQLDREIVGSWAEEKHAMLRRYVDITWATRKKFSDRKSSYIDPYCGPGRARTGDGKVIDGSAVLAAKEAQKHFAFSEVHIGDLRAANVSACSARLVEAGVADVHQYVGKAEETVQEVVQRLDQRALHLAFLDPYSVHALPFRVIETVASLQRADMLIHFSKMDFQRNVDSMSKDDRLEALVPGWADVFDPKKMGVEAFRTAIFSLWRKKIVDLGYHVSDEIVPVEGPNGSEIYWLLLASRHPLADKFWKSVSRIQPQHAFNF